jgi:hypothetical protein
MKYDENGFQIVQAALSVARRVMLERPRDYKQELVNLGCKPDDLGTVTWNHMTRGVDVSGTVDLDGKGLTELPFQFGIVSDDFDCSHNRLASLEGCPREVSRDFNCSDNRLTSLEGAPEKVSRDFNCSDNQLTSLEGAPEKISGNFYCSYNQFTSLEGAPREVGEDFVCSADYLIDVSALRRCKIHGMIGLDGLKADRARVTKLLRAQGFKGRIG